MAYVLPYAVTLLPDQVYDSDNFTQLQASVCSLFKDGSAPHIDTFPQATLTSTFAKVIVSNVPRGVATVSMNWTTSVLTFGFQPALTNSYTVHPFEDKQRPQI